MKLIKRLRTVVRQFLQNLAEPGWMSRHVEDRGPDVPAPSQQFNSAEASSSLSIALQQMGLVRQSPV